MISDDDAEKASEFLRDGARRYGQLKGRMEYATDNLRRVKSLVMLDMEGGLGDRETKAYASTEYLAAIQERREAVEEFETERALRDAAQYRIEVWRSQLSARKQGL